MERLHSKIDVVSKTGARLPAVVEAEDKLIGSKEVFKITLKYAQHLVCEESDQGFFDALRKVRLLLEQEGVLLCCFGASEDVYPSPMQEDMGPALLAYRTHLGRQALSKDIVHILDSDESVKPSTVQQQELFHRKWLESLA